MNELYIGLMSGTSIDGIDAALVDLSQPQPIMLAAHYTPYPKALRDEIIALCHEGADEINRMGILDRRLGEMFAHAALSLLHKKGLSPHHIKAIGSHGQTIRHYPEKPYFFTLQIADPNTISVLTGITTVADFRRKDLAVGGQGAPLAPAFHQYVFASDVINRVVVNIGGIANVTLLPQDKNNEVIGFDTGPGNILLDTWIRIHRDELQDEGGAWGAQGCILPKLLKSLLSDHYFQLKAPKSSGREYFNLSWLEQHIKALEKEPASTDVQATLIELTAQSILSAIKNYFTSGEILICGGGAKNNFLMSRLSDLATPNFNVFTTQRYGIDPDWVEAIAFAWLAHQTLNHKPSNIPSVTGAKNAVILGGVYF